MKQGSLIVLAMGLASMPAMADEEVNRTIDASDDGYIEIFNTSGNIEVTGWSRNSVQIDAVLGDSVEELIVERDGNEILIRVEVPNRHWGDIEADLDIRVPEGSTIEVSGVSTDIEIAGVLGEQSLGTVSGDIEVTGAADDIEAESVSGDVSITGDGGEGSIEAATVSGDVTVKNLSGSVEAESVSGDVEIIGGVFDDAYFESVNGDLTFHANLTSNGDLSLESVNGTVDIEFTEAVSARFDIETFNGSIRNCFGPKPERTSKYSPGLELSFTVGDGDARVEVETLNGSVNICNQD
ncbi:MAG: DUF4097 family beta strand repeat-containing protein [Woeseiaceae bacterium]